MNRTSRTRLLPMRVPWWGRLEVRVVAALSLLGILCVGASAYLVQLAVKYFDDRVATALAAGEDVAESIEPFQHDLVEAQISAFQARARAMALELALGDREPAPDSDESRLQAMLERESDVVALTLERNGAATLRTRESEFPQSDYDWFDTVAEVPGPDGNLGGKLRVVFLIDPVIDARYQALGELKREIGVEQSARPEIEDAVERVVSGASVAVLLLSLLAGFGLARTTTRKAGELRRVMARVGQGDLDVRARALGRDELGQLGQAFNLMLDELRLAQERVAYLQRIGAWQEMARRIAHEIKNPLTPIQLAAEQLRDKDPKLSPEFSRMLQTSVEVVEDEIAALRRMVTSFSQFAKMPEVRLETIEVGPVLHEFERAYGHLTDEEGDVLQVQVPQAPVRIRGDRQLLKQALVNLVENAVLSARDAGRAPVEVVVSAELDGECVEIAVDDNGPGIPPERVEQVFEPYETTRSHGTGLGLPIVKKVVLDHGGEVWAESSQLGGARFVLRLPVL